MSMQMVPQFPIQIVYLLKQHPELTTKPWKSRHCCHVLFGHPLSFRTASRRKEVALSLTWPEIWVFNMRPLSRTQAQRLNRAFLIQNRNYKRVFSTSIMCTMPYIFQTHEKKCIRFNKFDTVAGTKTLQYITQAWIETHFTWSTELK